MYYSHSIRETLHSQVYLKPHVTFFEPSVAFSIETLLVVTKPVHCLTLSRGGRAESHFGQQKTSKQNCIREPEQKVVQT